MDEAEPVGGLKGGDATARHWFTAAGAVAILVALLPPVDALAVRYVFAETAQFAVFALVAPALIVAGAPWRALRLSRADAGAARDAAAGAGTSGPADRLAGSRRRHRSFPRAMVFLLAFMVAALAWRLPPVMDALVTRPWLMAVELLTLLPAGTGLWLELLPSPPLEPRLPRPQRVALSALAMWFIWVIAYVIGMNYHGVFASYGDLPGRALSLLADQEIAAGIMWVVAGLAFIPVVFVAMLGWLKDSDDPEEELQRIARDEQQRAMVRGWGRPRPGRKAPTA